MLSSFSFRPLVRHHRHGIVDKGYPSFVLYLPHLPLFQRSLSSTAYPHRYFLSSLVTFSSFAPAKFRAPYLSLSSSFSSYTTPSAFPDAPTKSSAVPPSIVTASSLNELYQKRLTVTHVHLSSSPDLKCMNLMCEKLGYGCACRLALSLEKCGPQLQLLDLSCNTLPILPDSLWSSNIRKSLQTLYCNDNILTSLSLPPVFQKFASSLPANDKPTLSLSAKKNNDAEGVFPFLRTLNLRNNQLSYESIEPLLTLIDHGYFPSLQILYLQGNPKLDHDARWKNHHLYSRFTKEKI